MTGPAPVAVIGPTGTGKSELALDLAERLGGEVVNCDAMQQYRGMDIGTAKLRPEERRGIPHHRLDVLDVTHTASVADFRDEAEREIAGIRDRGHVPILCGGSMMYIQALVDGWSIPDTDPEVRARYERRLEEIGVRALHDELARVDPEAARTILPTDPRRTVRALEVVELTGRPFSASRPTIGEPRFGTRLIGLRCALPELDDRLAARTSTMFADGLVEEVRGLVGVGLLEGVTARRAIGYAQVLDEMDDALRIDDDGLARAEERTVIGTRRYVRRQRSWFGRDHRIRWIDTDTRDRADDAPRPLDAALRILGEGSR
ncbi:MULTISPECIES: tRNA (adenosine(37)-N6)-dimethylallyltransferase MiaA [Dietzia]|uniref:tRNA dimethylallyltransferase n=1 Tax=Dietzia cinnamea TaxID=321318 RepID=A0A4R3ZZ14_9ACTN|nr:MULTISPECIES: tRNA (adenosine(37)-N6)-dimethylallyltransferase MiaA [Dietzia]KZO60400.1 tRNA (adenosine(37)-N6)-dimethylallyltransferase MiaA [Dietzia maris]MCT1886597.1 tRNA (adenosine(37)-N6)-dimethylallyltransferase MiaA [Dietzia cinnamea]MCT2059543.1 tRNA (adenosine(37)-N6)-dimethylallyltransferase MiaA [Dietzia cinnamea]MCT2099834.1 tRNA (adenosine(37)-N6)-dimethylallyltransferase MiaA [Dietzia cinnamea]MCT2122351.1 tRNA (adenosine(37)-N6)-dimethylallyltransferase MiaA [Dietzia cinname